MITIVNSLKEGYEEEYDSYNVKINFSMESKMYEYAQNKINTLILYKISYCLFVTFYAVNA